MSQAKTLEISQRGKGVAQITMSRHEVFNAFDEVMIGERDHAFNRLTNDDDVRVIVLAGAGKHFSAGADLNWMQRMAQASEQQNRDDSLRLAGLMRKLAFSPKTTIARIFAKRA